VAITHRYTIVCDEVRKEDNGKILVIGMYMGNIAVPQIPFSLPSLTFLQVLDSDRPGHFSMRLRVQHLETGNTLVDGHGGMMFQQPGVAVMPIRFGNIAFQAVGTYNFIVEVEGQQLEPIITSFVVTLNIPQQGQIQPMRPPTS